jgi:hypothetical protein
MICPIRELGFLENDCEETKDCLESECAWWNNRANFNPKTKQFEGQCCILTLSRLKISGGVNTHQN